MEGIKEFIQSADMEALKEGRKEIGKRIAELSDDALRYKDCRLEQRIYPNGKTEWALCMAVKSDRHMWASGKDIVYDRKTTIFKSEDKEETILAISRIIMSLNGLRNVIEKGA